MALGAILNPINTTIIAVALIPIAKAFGVSSGQSAWLVSALYVTTAIGQPIAGRLVDIFGPRSFYLTGTALVGLGGVIGTVAAGFPMLVVARVVIGIGTCVGYPSAMYLLRAEDLRLGRENPQRVLTLLSVSSQTVAVVGPTLGGILIGMQGWRATFAVNVPMAALAFAAGWLVLPRRAKRLDLDRRLARLDLRGVACFAACLTSLLVVLMEPSQLTLPCLAVALTLGVAFIRLESRVAEPFLDVSLLAGNRPLVVTYCRQCLSGVVTYGQLYGFSQWLQDGRGLSPASAGSLLIPMSLSALLVSVVAGTRVSARVKLIWGSVTLAVTSLAFLSLTDETHRWLLGLVAVGIGVPQGLISLGNQEAMYVQVDPARTASSAGLLRTAMYLGALGASAAMSALFEEHAESANVHDLGVIFVLVSALLLVLTLRMPGAGRVKVT